MGKKNKLRKFRELLAFPNTVENYNPKDPKLILGEEEEVNFKGSWSRDFFGNDHPITLELACGRGEYTVQLGRKFKDRNFLGVDIKGARIWQGAKQGIEERLDNVRFLRTRIEQLDLFFEKGEVDEIWITFPDPFHAKENRRLTSPAFLERYKNIITDSNIIHLKTDDDILYEYSLESLLSNEEVDVIYHHSDIYSQEKLYLPELEFKTYYEGRHLSVGKTIKYIQFSIKNV